MLSNIPSLLKYMVVSRKFIVLVDFSAVNFIVGKHWLQWSKKVFSLSSQCVHTRNMSSMNLFQIRGFFWSGAEVSKCVSHLSIKMFAKLVLPSCFYWYIVLFSYHLQAEAF